MKPRETMLILFFVLIAAMIGSKDLIAYHWHSLSADAQIKWFAGAVLFFGFVAYWISRPFL